MAGVLGFFILRNFLLITQRFFLRRQRQALRTKAINGEKSSDSAIPKPFLLRCSDRIDSIALRPCQLPLVPQDWNYLRLALTILISAANITCCLVRAQLCLLQTENRKADLSPLVLEKVIASTSPIPNQAGSSVARAFSRRCGRIAIANFPVIFALAGRNSVIKLLTGTSFSLASDLASTSTDPSSLSAPTGISYQVCRALDETFLFSLMSFVLRN